MTKYLYSTVLLLIAITIASNVIAQKVKWYTFSEAVKLNEKAPRKILVDVYTDWCGWCKVMDEQTFQDPIISKILNEKYYAVKFDAERKDTVIFQGNTFVNAGEGSRPPHQLAVAMLNGKMSYPSIVFLDEKNQLVTAVPGFQKPEQMEPLLMYIFESLYEKNVNFQEYSQNYKSKPATE
jgi:thioredoxin-related protein